LDNTNRFTHPGVILRCELLRASKDGRKHNAEYHPSRLAEDGEHLRMTVSIFSGPEDDGRDSFAELGLY
jgi:hypothetical protein